MYSSVSMTQFFGLSAPKLVQLILSLALHVNSHEPTIDTLESTSILLPRPLSNKRVDVQDAILLRYMTAKDGRTIP